MDGHLMFPIYGTLIIVIIYRISLIYYMKKTNMVSERDWALLPHGRAQENNNDELQICLIELDPSYSTRISRINESSKVSCSNDNQINMARTFFGRMVISFLPPDTQIFDRVIAQEVRRFPRILGQVKSREAGREDNRVLSAMRGFFVYKELSTNTDVMFTCIEQ